MSNDLCQILGRLGVNYLLLDLLPVPFANTLLFLSACLGKHSDITNNINRVQYVHPSLLSPIEQYALDRVSTTPYGSTVSLKMDACFMTYTPLLSVVYSLSDVGFYAFAKPIEANVTSCRKEQCKS